jgi:hypothetical protein
MKKRMSRTAGSHTSKIPGNSRNANNSVILNTERKSATAGRHATAGYSGVIDLFIRIFATSVVDWNDTSGEP